jgi:small conductance mechanosensitive channel
VAQTRAGQSIAAHSTSDVDREALMWMRLFETGMDAQKALLALVLTLATASVVARIARRAIERVFGAAIGDSHAAATPSVRRPLRIVSVFAFILTVAVLLFPLLELLGARRATGVPLSALNAWLFASGLRILLVILLAYFVVRIVTVLVSRFEYEISQGTALDVLERARRAKTLGSVIRKAVSVAVVGIALLMVLPELGLNITPVLTGAGIAGLAIGFGAQTLVRDVISGFFVILENQVRVGDVAAINGVGGLVEAINLRTIVLRDVHGTVHVFPMGAIQTLANHSMDFAYAVIDVGVGYGEDTDRVTGVLREVGAALAADEAFQPHILDQLEILGVDALGDSQVVIKIRIKTVPLKQWEVGRELRRRIKKAFDTQGIEIPFPQRTVHIVERPTASG